MKTLLVASLAIAALLGSCAYSEAQVPVKLPKGPISPHTMTASEFFLDNWDQHAVGTALISGIAAGTNEILSGHVCFYGKRMTVGIIQEDMKQAVLDYPEIAKMNLVHAYRWTMRKTYPCQP